jgi:hypothetical protein
VIQPNELEKAFYKDILDGVREFEQAYRLHVMDPTTDEPQPDRTLHDAFVLLNRLGLSERETDAVIYIARSLALGVIHSLLATIDGASELGKALELIDTKTGKPLTSAALHENFYFCMD